MVSSQNLMVRNLLCYFKTRGKTNGWLLVSFRQLDPFVFMFKNQPVRSFSVTKYYGWFL